MPLCSRHLTPADHRVMPWKNGQGQTTEIVSFPPGSTLETFTYRVSIADLGASGPFSVFPGVDRILVQTSGHPMTVTHEGRPPRPLRLLSPVRFPGEWPTHGDVPTPPVRDFNVMTRRALVTAGVTVHELAPGSTVHHQHPAMAHLVHALRGTVSIQLGTAGLPLSTPPLVTLSPGDTWLLTADPDDDTAFDLSAAGAAAVAILVSISPAPRP